MTAITLSHARRIAAVSNPVRLARTHGLELEAALAAIQAYGTGNRGRDAAASATLRSAIAFRDHRAEATQ